MSAREKTRVRVAVRVKEKAGDRGPPGNFGKSFSRERSGASREPTPYILTFAPFSAGNGRLRS